MVAVVVFCCLFLVFGRQALKVVCHPEHSAHQAETKDLITAAPKKLLLAVQP
jgi:hypothetical protein